MTFVFIYDSHPEFGWNIPLDVWQQDKCKIVVCPFSCHSFVYTSKKLQVSFRNLTLKNRGCNITGVLRYLIKDYHYEIIQANDTSTIHVSQISYHLQVMSQEKCHLISKDKCSLTENQLGRRCQILQLQKALENCDQIHLPRW